MSTTTKKRKRGGSAPKNPAPPPIVINLEDTEDEEMPLAKKATPPSTASSSWTVAPVATPPPKKSSSSQTTFKVPAAVVRKVRNHRRNNRKKPSVDQERHTDNCREMRKAVVGVMFDVHEDIRRGGGAEHCGKCIRELLDSLWLCLKKYPFMFSSASKVLKLGEDDAIPSTEEIQDFMMCWLHGLSSLLFQPSLKSIFNNVSELLQTYSRLLSNGNPDVLEIAFAEILNIISNLFIKGERLEVMLEFGDAVPMRRISILYRQLPQEENEELICDWLKILRSFIPPTLHFRVIEQGKFVKFFHTFWETLSSRCKFKALGLFLVPVIPRIADRSLPTELSLFRLVSTAVSESTNLKDLQSLNSFQRFCQTIKEDGLLDIMPQNMVLLFHSYLSNLIASDYFETLPTDDHRSGIIQLWLLADKTLKVEHGEQEVVERNVCIYQRSAKTLQSFEFNHPLLESSIFSEVQETFNRRTSRQGEKSWAFHPEQLELKDILLIKLEKECSLVWNKVLGDFEFSNLENLPFDDFSVVKSFLKKSCFLIQLASNVNRRLIEYTKERNQSQKTIIIPELEILDSPMMIAWTGFVVKVASLLLSGTTATRETDELLCLILDTISSFHEGAFLHLRLPIHGANLQLVSIAGAPWFKEFKKRLPAKSFPPRFFKGVQESIMDNLLPTTKAKCLSTLCLPMFLPYRDFVLLIVATQMKTLTSTKVANSCLKLIYEESWVARSLGWNSLIVFINRVQTNLDWKKDPQLRNSLASAITRLPCIYTTQKILSNLASDPSKSDTSIQVLLNPCSFCKDVKKSEDNNEVIYSRRQTNQPLSSKDQKLVPIPEDKVQILVQLSLPILRDRFKLAKITLCKLIRTVMTHSDEYNHHLIAEFATVAALGSVCVGSEIMKWMGLFLLPKEFSIIFQEYQKGDDRSNGLELFFNTLLHFLYKAFEAKKSVGFATKMQIILREFAANADRPMAIELLRYAMRLVMHRDSTVRNLLSQAIVITLATRANCLAWELMTRLRYDLSANMVELIREEYTSFSTYPEQFQKERMHAFLTSWSITGEFRTDSILIHHYYPVMLGEIVPYLHNDPRYQFILKCMAKFASTSEAQILKDGFPHYCRELILTHGIDRSNICLKYVKDKYQLDTIFLATNPSQTTLNEMLCYLHDRKAKVLKLVPNLCNKKAAEFVLSSNASPARSEIQENLYRHLMGFILYVDTKLHSRLECVTTKRRLLQSFITMIDLMGKTRITLNRSKVYATLNCLFVLGPEFSDLLYESWRMFAMNLEPGAFGQMSVQILAAVTSLHDYMPQQVENLITHYIHTRREQTFPYYIELYFVTDFTKDANVLEPINKCIADHISAHSWVNFFELLVRESFHENSHIRLRAIHKLHYCLVNEYEKVKTLTLEREHPIVAQLLTSFLNTSRDADKSTLMLLSESFGALGAVDPYRFMNSKDEEMRRRSTPVLTVEGYSFAVKYLEVLAREFQESEDTTDFDYCACLIQQLLLHFGVKRDDNDPVWYALSNSSKELVEPLLVSKYKVEKILPKLNITSPIYLSEYGKIFDQWVAHWLTLMAAGVEKDSKAWELFQFSRFMIPRNSRIASFLLPYVATYACIGGSINQRREIVQEIDTILRKWIEQDKLKASSQHLLPVKESQADLGTPDPEPKVFYDEDVIQYRCTQEVFAVFDHLFKAARAAKRQAGLARANKAQNRRASIDLKSFSNPCLSENQADSINGVLAMIPLSTVSQVAFHCEDYKRALFYLEQDLKKYPNTLLNRLNYLQQLHVSLNDMDSVVGVVTVRKREPTMNEMICESFAKGKIEEGVRSLELMVNENPDDLIATNGLLQAYLSLDEPRKAETLIKGCVSRNPHWEVALEEFQIEATWKLRDWSKLKSQIDSKSLIQVEDEPTPKIETQPTWVMTVVKILSLVQGLQIDTASHLVNETRLKLMNPLVAAANDYNAYSRSYSNVVQLHILTEVEQVINLIEKSRKPNFSLESSIKELIGRWSDREHIILKSQKFVDPVLNVRKSLLEILKDLAVPTGPSLQMFNRSIRDCWLTAAKVESKAGSFTRAYNCITEAKKYNSAKVMFEHAKLLLRKGDKEQALQVLQSSIPTFFPKVDDWKTGTCTGAPASVIEDRKLCSFSLQLVAKLSDELNLLDIDKNVKNYESSIKVYNDWEGNHFALACYYDKVFSNLEDKTAQSSIQGRIVKFYANSLHYGCKFVYQSLPRLLSIWFDFAALGFDAMKNVGRGSYSSNKCEVQPHGWLKAFTGMQETIKLLSEEVPAYVLLTAFSQLISRICHANPKLWDLLIGVIGSIICTHPHQTLWMTMAVSKSSYSARKSRCMEIYKSVEKKKPTLKPIIQDYTLLADKLIEVCVKDFCNTQITKTTMSKTCPSLPKLLQSNSFGNVLVPFQVFMSPSLPPNGSSLGNYDAFPQKFVFIKGVEEHVDIMISLVRPKKITLIGSDGKRYTLLCKANDDLRKDSKVMEVNNVVNWYLHRNQESRERQLHVRIYGVTPLNEIHGLLEWVPNLSGIRGSTLSLYRDRGLIISMKELKNIMLPNDALDVRHKKFVDYFIKPFPAVFSDWFLNNFNDPQSWYKARLSYIRTAAVISIVGFILGLGDRHGENILIDSSNGDLVHVDFNCLFNKGETFDTPERVPFRLTQNIVEAMGPLGVEGVFRRSCEITMSLFRQHKDVFLSVLRPFVFDPLVEWEKTSSSGASNNGKLYGGSSIRVSSGDSSISQAIEHLKHIENRMIGSARNFTKNVNTQLSIEAQVAYLIDEARSIDNLCRMFLGWTAFI